MYKGQSLTGANQVQIPVFLQASLAVLVQNTLASHIYPQTANLIHSPKRKIIIAFVGAQCRIVGMA